MVLLRNELILQQQFAEMSRRFPEILRCRLVITLEGAVSAQALRNAIELIEALRISYASRPDLLPYHYSKDDRTRFYIEHDDDAGFVTAELIPIWDEDSSGIKPAALHIVGSQTSYERDGSDGSTVWHSDTLSLSSVQHSPRISNHTWR